MTEMPDRSVGTVTVQQSRDSLIVYDDFTDHRACGKVIGTQASSGHKRLGVDAERVLSIDNGSLRIAPLLEAGFGREVLGYGPLSARPGLAFAVYMLNGHNTAQAEQFPDTFRMRMSYWLCGSGTDPKAARLIQWLRSGRVRRVLRQIRRWKRAARGERPVPLLDENLAVGFFPTFDTIDPREAGNTFIMHALGPENGELWAGSSGNRTRALPGLQNVPLYYVGILRQEGIVYYVSSLDGAVGPGVYPWLRPVAIDTAPGTDEIYLCIHQSVLGQIGWRLDTRVHGVRVADMAGFESRFGGAHAADCFVGTDPTTGDESKIGGKWQVWADNENGGDHTDLHSPSAAETISVLDPGVPSGLIYTEATHGQGAAARTGLVWRFQDRRNYWRLVLGSNTCEMGLVTNGVCQVVASRTISSASAQKHRLQVLDHGSRMMAYVNGAPLFDKWMADSRLNEATGTGTYHQGTESDKGAIHLFEAHPRQIKLPEVLDMGEPWMRKGTKVIVADDFSGEAGELAGRITPVGEKKWSRLIGNGVIEITGMQSAHVRSPCPGRTAYCIDWPNPDFVELEITITPPVNESGQKQRTTAGFIIYQDSENYMTLNTYRSVYPGGSVSTFFKFNGFEDIYDAIWVNVADRVSYGRPVKLTLCCDGTQYLVFLNDETVLYRSFRDVYPDVKPLRINKVGIVANWEFGTDTGSSFRQCTMRC